MAKIRVQQKSTGAFAKILFAILCVVVAVGVCIMLIALPNSKVNSTISASSQNKNTDENKDAEIELNDENIPFDVRTGGKFVMHVALIDFADVQQFNTDEAIAEVNKLFNEQVVNDFLSVSEYYNEISKGKLNIVANISYIKLDSNCEPMTTHEADYAFEKALFDKAIKEGELKVFNGQYNASVVIMAGSAYYKKITHPHTYMGKRLMTLANSMAYSATLCHETGHMFGLYDLYTGTPFDVVYTYELMGATNRDIIAPINAYHRSTLNWLSESSYEDDISTDIEKITKSGNYMLMPCTADQGIVAYKLFESADGNESFYAEYRVPTGEGICNQLPYGEQGGLYIYRVNKTCQNGNLGAIRHSDCEIFTFPSSFIGSGNRIFVEGNTIGKVGSNICLLFSNETKAAVNITNIKITEEGLTFDIDFAQTEINEYYGIVYSPETYKMVGGADIYVNGTKVTTTDANGIFSIAARVGDKVKFVADYYETKEITLTNVIILEIQLNATIGTFTVNSGYSNYNIKFYQDDELLLDTNSYEKTKTLRGPINLNKKTSYKMVYTRGEFTKTVALNFTTSGKEIVVDIDPYIDENTASRTYSGQLMSKNGIALTNIDVYLNGKVVTYTDNAGKFSFTGKKDYIVEFIKDNIVLATQTLGLDGKIDIVSDYIPVTVLVSSNNTGFNVKLYNGSVLVQDKDVTTKSITLESFIKYDETKKFKLVYTRGDFKQAYTFDMSKKNAFYNCSVKEPEKKEKSILDQIGEGFDYFTYNMGKGFEELGRIINPLNWF